MFAAWMLCVLCSTDPLVCSNPTFDAGQAYVGQRLIHKFVVRNSAAEIMTITDVRGSCGCAAPEVSRRKLSPGESAELTVDVNTLSQPAGPVRWNTHVVWRCGAADAPADADDDPGDGTASVAGTTNLADKHMPASCRSGFGGDAAT